MITENDARAFLQMQGYYVDNLWHIDDVQNNHDLSDEAAYEILDKVMQSEYMMSNIFEMIDEQVNQ